MSQVPIKSSATSGVALASISGEVKILMMKRSKEGFWCHVAGTIEDGEEAWETIIREFREETGVIVNELYSGEYIEQFYEPEKNCISMVPVFVAMLEPDVSIELNGEHTEYKWCTLNEAKSLAAFPNQKSLYDHVWYYFVDNEPSKYMRVKIR